MESFTQMADRWIRENLPASNAPQVAKEANYAKEGVSGGMSEHDPEAWADDFHDWALTHCAYSERRFWSIRHLHLLFSDWALRTDRVPCRLDTFERLLNLEGFCFAGGLVSGLFPLEIKPKITPERKS